MTLTATTAEKTVTVELAVPTNLGDLTIVQPAKSAWNDDQWASYINAPEANPVLAIIERGKRLKERRDACDQKGDRSNTFEAFCEKFLNIRKAMVYRYIAIHEMAESRLPQYTTLPASVAALYELTRLTDAEFSAAIQSGA